MFKMIGGDGREYGPISTEQLRQWIAEQRANGQTMLQREGSADWLPLSAFPEFAEALGTAWPGQPGETITPPPHLELERESAGRFAGPTVTGSVDIADCLGRGWVLLGRHFLLMSGASGLVWLISTGTAFIPCAGPFISLAISGALYGGLALVFLRLIRQQSTSLGEVFAGFGPVFATLLLVWVITSLASWLGLLFCLIPGLILKVLWTFSIPLAADRTITCWAAMEASRKAVARNFFPVAGLLCVAWLPVIVFEGYSILRTTAYLMETLGPINTWTLDSLRIQMEEIGSFAMKIEIQRQVVLLLNLPFASAAVMYAYEGLFGARRPETNG